MLKVYNTVPLLLALLQIICANTAQQVDYCAPAYMCGSQHILACNHTGQFDKRCPANAAMIPMTPEYQEMFVNEHNKYRNEIAEGLIYKPAAAMATLEWDEELSKLAEYNVKQCGMIFETKCLTTGPYHNIDQNIGRVFYLKSKFNSDNIMPDIIKHMKVNWYDEHHDCTQAEIDSYKPPQYELILFFGKMMLDRNNRIGCAASIYENDYGIDVLFTCNYARFLYCYKPIFRSGEYAGSNCKTGMNPRYPFLCSTKEPFNVNDYSV